MTPEQLDELERLANARCSCTYEAGDSDCEQHPTDPQSGDPIGGWETRDEVTSKPTAKALIAALRAERARTERLQVALNFAGTWMATDLSPEGTQAYADFLALAETKELP